MSRAEHRTHPYIASLSALADAGEATPAELAEATGHAEGSEREYLRRLERDGLAREIGGGAYELTGEGESRAGVESFAGIRGDALRDAVEAAAAECGDYIKSRHVQEHLEDDRVNIGRAMGELEETGALERWGGPKGGHTWRVEDPGA